MTQKFGPLCPHCELPLKKQLDTPFFKCGICGSTFRKEELSFPVSVEISEEVKRAKELLRAEENNLGHFKVIRVDDTFLPAWKKGLSLLGVPVEEAEYSTHITPWIGLIFAALCLLLAFASPVLILELALLPSSVFRHGGLNFFTYSLVHAGFLHLIFNFLFLWPFMDNVEEHLGHRRALALIVVSALGASILHILVDSSDRPLVGSSGVCFGFATYYCLQYPRNRFLMMIPFVGLFAYKLRLRVRALHLLIGYILLEVSGVLTQVVGQDSTSHLGHIGGAIGGFALWLFWGQPNKDEITETLEL
jgi:membrane associated rhomboid family serine protease